MYYNWGRQNGKEFVAGPYPNEEKAREVGFRAYDGGDFETYDLNTRDFSEAVRRIRHIRLEGGDSLEVACARKKRVRENIEPEPAPPLEYGHSDWQGY